MSPALWIVCITIFVALAVVLFILQRCNTTTVAVATRTSERASKQSQLSEIRTEHPLARSVEMDEMGDDRVQLQLPTLNSLRSPSSFLRLHEEEEAKAMRQQDAFQEFEEEELAADIWVPEEPRSGRRSSQHIEYDERWEPVVGLPNLMNDRSTDAVEEGESDEPQAAESPVRQESSSECTTTTPPAEAPARPDESDGAPIEPPLETLARTAGAAGRRPATRRHGLASAATEPGEDAKACEPDSDPVPMPPPPPPPADATVVASSALVATAPPVPIGGTFALELSRAVTAKALRSQDAELVVESEAAPPPTPSPPTTWMPRAPLSACASAVAPFTATTPRPPLPLTPAVDQSPAPAGTATGTSDGTFAQMLERAVVARASGRAVDFAERLEEEVTSRVSNRSATSSFAAELAHQARRAGTPSTSRLAARGRLVVRGRLAVRGRLVVRCKLTVS